MIYYTVYKTTNLVNSKYYFGVHKTANPYDSYLGSGVYIKRAVAKHGEHNFRKDVLFIYHDPASAFGKEDELIQAFRGRDPLCMNLRKGGGGGFDWINRNRLHSTVEGRKKLKEILLVDPEYLKKAVAKAGSHSSEKRRAQLSARFKGNQNWLGRRHLQRTKQKMAEAAKAQNRVGQNNPQFGTRWIQLGGAVKKVSGAALSEYLAAGWLLGRKVRS